MHKLIIIGNLGRDPEMRYMPNGSPVTNFSLASNRRYKTSEGEDREETVWVRVSCFGRLAEVTNEYLSKGRQVYVEGRLRADENGNPRTFSRNDGSTGTSYEVVAQTVHFLGARGDTSTAPTDGAPAEAEEEIPF